ncbi:NADAR family protein [Rhizobium laguerreae]|uniref:NADAR family protein n=1 Tax=Rhizobium laguerreae TaxID=1076926 RepID=UPI001C9040DF|nr:NADAR family protein [Rhizobium laguerreae]MBY3151325.1 NADAR family protein [Rhizobium laguerreae]MBY3433520.1 NADAR family protein [Rhizobium laguerreae]
MDLTKFKMRTTPTHVYFWGGPFSQWFKSSFVAELPVYAPAADDKPRRLLRSGIKLRFSSCEQYMMAAKASVFGDTGKGSVLEKILGTALLFGEADTKAPGFQSGTHDVAKIKALGRQVPGLKGGKWDKEDIAFWDKVSLPVVTIGNLSKYTQSDELYQVLVDMGEREFVEGAPNDDQWGVALAWNDPKIEDPANWLGKNKLGKVHNTVSRIIFDHGRDIDPWKVLAAYNAGSAPAPTASAPAL